MRQVFRYSLLIFIFFSIPCLVSAQEDWIPDENLRHAVRDELSLPAAKPLTKELMAQLVFLNAGNKGIETLTGLETATNLIELHIHRNPITDLKPLANLTKLRSFHFWHIPPKITDLDLQPLANLTALEFLSLEGNGIKDIRPLKNLKNLQRLHLTHNHIVDFSPLSELTNLWQLWINDNFGSDFSPLSNLTLTDFRHDEFCDLLPSGKPVEERIKDRNFPSITGFWPEKNIHKYDLHYGHLFGIRTDWDKTVDKPTHGLATQITGDIKKAKAFRDALLQKNPNMIFLLQLRVHNHLPSNGATAFPEGSDFYLRDRNGNIIRNSVGEYMMNILNQDLQDVLIDRIVGFSQCGIFDGVLLDGFLNHGIGAAGSHFYPTLTDVPLTPETIIEAHLRILRGVREHARDDFLIIVNANHSKPTRYAEYINGSSMEPGEDYQPALKSIQGAGSSYKRLKLLDETLLWNEANLREPIINWSEGFFLPNEPPNSPNNQRRMRLFTARGLTHSNGYIRMSYVLDKWRDWMDTHNYWYDFWDTDLGKPIGEKGKLYDDNIDGVFIREFTNGWAVYNRSGQAQEISLPIQTTGVASGITSFKHTLPDLDGEMYLKTQVNADVNGDGVVNIQDLVIVANALGEAEPDVNGDGVVNIQDLVIVANAFGQ
ncbi:MAG: leucine-rich repeat domain-containing protein [Candidatus Poribacteria bacterium]|nr:leucine-rich repeat domain-containing protein [Candidatus Poribacteria bacterium]